MEDRPSLKLKALESLVVTRACRFVTGGDDSSSYPELAEVVGQYLAERAAKVAVTEVRDGIKWRWLVLERRREYAHERYDYVAEGGAFWIVERLAETKSWIAWLIAGDRLRIQSSGPTPGEALEGVYADALELDARIGGALRRG